MITLSHDPDAGTLYWYLSDIEEGAVQLEGECDATLLLDAEGLIIGALLELDESIRPQDLVWALRHPGVSYDQANFTLTVLLFDEEPAEEQPLDEPAVLDFDAEERLLGFELLPAQTFGLDTRLERLANRLVMPDLVEELPPDPSEQVIAEWLSRQDPTTLTSTPDDAAAESDEEDAQDTDDDQDADERPLPEAEQKRAVEAEEAGQGAAVSSESSIFNLQSEQSAGTSSASSIFNLQSEQSVEPSPTDTATFRSGFVAIIGRPNVGKSTLLNTLLGQKVAIVSPKPQTTRIPMRGILNRPDAQIIFIDTPGIHDPRSKLGNFMVETARRTIPDADVVCFLVDITRPPGKLDRQIAALLQRTRVPHLLVLNKVDATRKQTANYLTDYRTLGDWDMEIAISARTGDGVPALLDELVRRLPLGPRLYPENQLSDQSSRELAAELVREKVLRFTEQEVPHSVAVEVEEWEQREHTLYIRMTVYTEKDSQKSILIGSGGAMLKRIGSAARTEIEAAVGQPVFLDLWVKTRPGWRDDPSALHWLGYSSRDKH